jgi:hypothetical protein
MGDDAFPVISFSFRALRALPIFVVARSIAFSFRFSFRFLPSFLLSPGFCSVLLCLGLRPR